MRALAPLLGGALALAACAPQAEAPAQVPQLDCALGFDALAAKIAAEPGVRPAPPEPGEPYRFYTSADASVSYMITLKGAPGHPAILEQRAAAGHVTNSGCPFGDKAGYDQLNAYLQSLAKAGGK